MKKLIFFIFISSHFSCCKSKKLKINESIYYLADYGANANDNLDDSRALSKLLIAIDKKKGIKKILFNQGTYIFNQQVNLISNIELVGNSTIIKTNTKAKNFIFFIGDYSKTKENIKIKGITILGDEVQRKYIGFGIKNYNIDKIYNNNIIIKNCSFKNLNHCIIVNNTYNLRIIDNLFINSFNVFVSLNNECVIIKDNKIININKGLIFADEGNKANKDVSIINNNIRKITGYPIHFSDVSSQATHTNIIIKKNIIIGDTIPYSKNADGGSADQISVHGAKVVDVFDNESIGGGDMGITITNCNDVKIFNNISAFNDRSGIVLSGGNEDILISNNTIYNNGQRKDGIYVNTGVLLYSSKLHGNKSVVISNNTIFDNQITPTQISQVEDFGPKNLFKIDEKKE